MKRFEVLLGVIFCVSVNAQNCDYDFSVSTGTYQDLNNSISLNNGNVWDDPAYAIPIGFGFEVCGNVYNTIYITDLGYGGSLFSETVPQGNLSIIIPFAQDIVDRGFGSSTSQSPLSYKTEGTAGNRVLKVEWNNVGFLTAPNDYMNFQLWIYENSNTLEYRFGSSSITSSSPFEGETGPVTTFYPVVDWNTGSFVETGYFLSGNPSNPTVIQLNNSTQPPTNTALNGMIPNGTIYAFTPKDLSITENQSGVFSIYPNPASDFLFIESKNGGRFQVEVYGLAGEKIKSFADVKNNRIDISGLSKGVYFVKIKNENGNSEVKKIVKK